jgi:hypothetical protein
MIYSLSLPTALLLVGLAVLAAHLVALFMPDKTQQWLKVFPRSEAWGTVLIVIAGAWFWWLVANMDLGEFSNWRKALKIGTPVVTFLLWQYVKEFLAVRSLGMIVLLAAEPLLEAAWLRPEISRLIMVTLVYIWISFALFWVGMPYTLRDQIGWVSASRQRWNAAAILGAVWGGAILISYLTLHR